MPEVNAVMRARTGLQNQGTTGQDITPSTDKLGAMLSQPVGKYYAAAKEGKIFNVCTTGAGVALGVDVEGTTQAFVLLNPSGSGVDCVMLNARVARGTTGDVGPGAVLWFGLSLGVDATLPTGTALTAVNGRIGGGGPAARPLQAATTPGTDPSRIRVLANLSEELITSVSAHAVLNDDVDGAIIVPPGAWVGISGEGDAGASPLIQLSVTWAEVPA